MNDFRFSGPASDKRRYWSDERHIRLMAKKRLRPVVIVGYALLLHEADARAQGEAVTRSVRLGLPVPFVDAAIGDHNGVHGVGAVCAGLLKLLRGRIPAVAARACACVGQRHDAACHAVLRVSQDEVVACAAVDHVGVWAAVDGVVICHARPREGLARADVLAPFSSNYHVAAAASHDVVAIAVSCADVVVMVGANKRIGLAVACKGDAFVGLACVDVDVACCA